MDGTLTISQFQPPGNCFQDGSNGTELPSIGKSRAGKRAEVGTQLQVAGGCLVPGRANTVLGAVFLGLSLEFIDERMHLIYLIAAFLAKTCACAVYFISLEF